jgi:replicative DNA helicase
MTAKGLQILAQRRRDVEVVLLLYVPESDTGEPTSMDQIIVGKMREGEKGPIDVRFNTRRLEYEPRFNAKAANN